MDKRRGAELKVPSELNVESRVWTIKGFKGHGDDGINLPAQIGGTIYKTSKGKTGNTLYHVKWDNDQESIHFYSQLIGIEKHKTLTDFTASLKFSGPVNITLNKNGEFLRAALFIVINRKKELVKLAELDGHLWKEVLKPIIEAAGIKITINHLKNDPKWTKY